VEDEESFRSALTILVDRSLLPIVFIDLYLSAVLDGMPDRIDGRKAAAICIHIAAPVIPFCL
jgi:hypothetical protein